MTHIDPFAPGDSEQHPANFRVPRKDPHGTFELQPQDWFGAHIWFLADPENRVEGDDPQAAIIGEQRWAEYEALMAEHGTDDEKARWGEPADEKGDFGPGEIPTLIELRARVMPEATEETQSEVKPEQDDAQALADRLKALEDAGL